MDFDLTHSQRAWRDKVACFMRDTIHPLNAMVETERAAGNRWAPIQTIETAKRYAKDAGLWNFFMPPASGIDQVDTSFDFEGQQLSNLEYALCAEEMGRVEWASEAFNCSAPDTGNMEVLLRYGTRDQKDAWLAPLMRGEIRSAFLMTEPDVASSDATNVRTSIVRDGDDYVINGRKWWSSGIGDPRCKIMIVMGRTREDGPAHSQQSMILLPVDTPGVRVERMLSVFGYDHAPHGHGEVLLEDVRVPAANMLLGEGRGFEIAQGRLGPGRIHHCMRTIGMAEEALELMARRLRSRVAFGKPLSEQSIWEERLANARIEIEASRLLCLQAADLMDKRGNKAARIAISIVKVHTPSMALKVIDDAIQAFGGAGVSEDFGLAASWSAIRTLRFADGPDEVHRRVIARAELARHDTDRGETR
jgi:acyl-CoA dehydrogenase